MTNACLHLHTHNRWFWSNLAQHSPLFSDYDTPGPDDFPLTTKTNKKKFKKKRVWLLPTYAAKHVLPSRISSKTPTLTSPSLTLTV